MTMMRAIGALGCLLVLGCDNNVGANQANQASEPAPVYQVRSEDAAMNGAKARAVAALPQFYARLARPAPDETEFVIKFDIVPGDEAEFVWAAELDRRAVPMTGVLINQPVQTRHRMGQRVPIPEAAIIDWMYRKGRVMQGGFTNRVLLEHMPADEARSLRDYLGW